MRELLVGSTGFVGSNLMINHRFEGSCHSSDIESFFDCMPNLCIYAGIPSSMYLANNEPNKDLEIMKNARFNIRNIKPQKLVLISTIAVYSDSRLKKEEDEPENEGLNDYGKNRLQLEKWVREDFENVLIIRLPALYGYGLKKNFLYDIHSIVPFMLSQEKFFELSLKHKLIEKSYSLNRNGFYVLDEKSNIKALKEWFMNSEFNALSFTDSRSKFQFYSLNKLYKDISIAINNNLKVLNICTPPVSASEVFHMLKPGYEWTNIIENRKPYDYNLNTSYSDLFGGYGNYMCTKDDELNDIVSFMNSWV